MTALKEAARQIFTEKGFLGARISDIPAGAGRAAGSCCHHFPSKEAVLEAPSVLRDHLHEMERAGRVPPGRGPGGHGHEGNARRVLAERASGGGRFPAPGRRKTTRRSTCSPHSSCTASRGPGTA
ncbi:TetR/AcrR family transcriptional regulator [Streptomyces sp. NBC_00247]